MTFSLEDLRGRPGVYTIFVRDWAYVGSAMDMYKRINEHIWDLSKGESCNKDFQLAYDEYGYEAVRLGDIKFCDVDTEPELRKFELIVMNRLREAGVELFNKIEPDTNPMAGRYHTEEARQKMHEAAIGKRMGVDNPMFGCKHTDEAKLKISNAGKGNQNALGCKHSEAMNRETSDFSLRHWRDPEYQKKQKEAWTDERRKKLSEDKKRYFQDPKNRKKHSDRMKRYYQDRRERKAKERKRR